MPAETQTRVTGPEMYGHYYSAAVERVLKPFFFVSPPTTLPTAPVGGENLGFPS